MVGRAPAPEQCASTVGSPVGMPSHTRRGPQRALFDFGENGALGAFTSPRRAEENEIHVLNRSFTCANTNTCALESNEKARGRLYGFAPSNMTAHEYVFVNGRNSANQAATT